LIDEDILCETNVVESPLKPKWRTRDSGQTALALTTLFAERFPKWAENYIQQDAQRRQQEGSTNAPTFTEENVAKINELLEPLHWIQQDTCKQTNITEKVLGASEALDILYKIRDLLPKDGNGGGSSQNQAQPEQNQEQKQEQEQNQEQNQPQDQKEEQQEKAAEEEKKEDTPQDVEEDLRRALQREREHEAEKQRQRREFPMSPNVRDW
jgi:septal ring factor EnvC (AmiA/AmiB activator)